MSLKLDLSKTLPYLKEEEVLSMQPMVDVAHKMLHEKSGLGSDFLGWVDLPTNYDKDEFARIKTAANNAIIFVVNVGVNIPFFIRNTNPNYSLVAFAEAFTWNLFIAA